MLASLRVTAPSHSYCAPRSSTSPTSQTKTRFPWSMDMKNGTGVPSPSPHTINPSGDGGNKSEVLLYVCVGVGGTLFLCVLVTIIVVFLRRRRRSYGGSFSFTSDLYGGDGHGYDDDSRMCSPRCGSCCCCRESSDQKWRAVSCRLPLQHTSRFEFLVLWHCEYVD